MLREILYQVIIPVDQPLGIKVLLDTTGYRF
jgi:hypothetical protein